LNRLNRKERKGQKIHRENILKRQVNKTREQTDKAQEVEEAS
jgi:hypothetical protein